MQNQEKAIVLSAESKPYKSAEYGEGVSHKVRLNIKGEIYSVKVTESQVSEFKGYVGKEGSVVVAFSSPKENLKMSIVSFEVKK